MPDAEIQRWARIGLCLQFPQSTFNRYIGNQTISVHCDTSCLQKIEFFVPNSSLLWGYIISPHPDQILLKARVASLHPRLWVWLCSLLGTTGWEQTRFNQRLDVCLLCQAVLLQPGALSWEVHARQTHCLFILGPWMRCAELTTRPG